MEKRGQVAMEFVVIATFSLLLIVSGAVLFRNYVYSSNDMIVQNKIAAVATDILVSARKIYYYGPPSKSELSLEMPGRIQQMYILAEPSNEEYFLYFQATTSDGTEEYFFSSDVPLISNSAPVDCDRGVCYYFDERVYTSGRKNIKVQATSVCPDTLNCVSIEEAT